MRNTNRALLGLFTFALTPFSLTIGGAGVNVNYIYMLFPFLFFLAGIKREIIFRKEPALIIAFFTIIYIVGIPIDILNDGFVLNNPVRRFISFLIFIFPLFLSFIKFLPEDLETLKRAMVLIAVIYASVSVVDTITTMSILISQDPQKPLTDWYGNSLVGTSPVTALKRLVGSQRYGFMLSLGLIITLLSAKAAKKRILDTKNLIFSSIILLGICSTFSRASILSLAGGLLFLLVLRFFQKNHPRIKRSHSIEGKNQIIPLDKIRLSRIVMTFVFNAVVLIIFAKFYQVNYLEFYMGRITNQIITPLMSSNMMETMANNPLSSEGYRYNLYRKVLEYISVNPFFGSSYKGLYLIFEEYNGVASTHNQYLDIFLRVGLFGGTLWLLLLVQIIRFCRHDESLLIGFVVILIYGLVHETFKLSHGSFIFGMLLSFSYLRLPQRSNKL